MALYHIVSYLHASVDAICSHEFAVCCDSQISNGILKIMSTLSSVFKQ